MTVSCKYHPGTPARWYCHHDGLYLCQSCVHADPSEPQADCLLCQKALTPVESGNNSRPLWQQLERFLRIPMAPVLIPLWLGWAVLAAALPGQGPGMLAALLGAVPVFLFAAALMACYGQGRPGRAIALPGWQVASDATRWRQGALLALPVLLVAGMSGLLMVWSGLLWGGVLMSLGLLVVPSLWLAVIVEDQGVESYSAVLTYAFTDKEDYGVMALFAVATAWLVLGLASVGQDLLPPPLARGVAAALLAWWTLALAALAGQVIQRQARLWRYGAGVPPRVDEPLDQRRLRLQLSAGRFDTALSTVAPGPRATLQQWQYHDRLLEVTGRHEQRQQQAESFLQVLARHEDWSRAQDVIRQQRQAQPGWLPQSPALRLQLAQGLHELQPRLAVQLLRDLHQSHPDFPEIADAYWLLARVLAEQFDQHSKAEQYLRFVESRGNTRLRQEIAAYRAARQ